MDMDIFNQLKEVIDSVEADAIKFYDKKNKAAGTRVRKAMQDLKKIAQDVRLDISEKSKAE
mgnify:CR=1 FL=1|jgi:hypothetical protein